MVVSTLISIMSNHGDRSSSFPYQYENKLYTDPILFYKACLQQHQLKLGVMNQHSNTKRKVIAKRPISPLPMAVIPQARWKVVKNPVSKSNIVMGKVLYHRVLKK